MEDFEGEDSDDLDDDGGRKRWMAGTGVTEPSLNLSRM